VGKQHLYVYFNAAERWAGLNELGELVVVQSEENSMVILSEVAGSRSEAAAESKDPYTLTDL